VQQIRIHRPEVPRERPWRKALPPDPRDPDVVRAKALARADDPADGTTAKQSLSPARRDGRLTGLPWITGEGPN
jgi:hypothetical protein